MSKKINFDDSLPDRAQQTRGMRGRGHSMSIQDIPYFYSPYQQERMKIQSRTLDTSIKQMFRRELAAKYSTDMVRSIMSNLEQQVEEKVDQQKKRVENLKVAQAKKYFLEEIILKELEKLALGQQTSFLPKPKTPKPPQIQPNYVTIKSIRGENTYIPLQQGVTNGVIKDVYGGMIGVDRARLKFIKNGKVLKDEEEAQSCVIVAIVKS